jgi:hypothetical protein
MMYANCCVLRHAVYLGGIGDAPQLLLQVHGPHPTQLVAMPHQHAATTLPKPMLAHSLPKRQAQGPQENILCQASCLYDWESYRGATSTNDITSASQPRTDALTATSPAGSGRHVIPQAWSTSLPDPCPCLHPMRHPAVGNDPMAGYVC